MKRVINFLQIIRDLLRPFSPQINLDILLAGADPKAPLSERVAWLQDLVAWLRSPIKSDERAKLKSRRAHIQTVRIRFLLHLLERNPKWKANAAGVVRSILRETTAIELFSSTGLTRESGFFSEALNRVSRKLLPVVDDDRDLANLFIQIFHEASDADWIESLPPEIFEKLVELIEYGEQRPTSIYDPIRDSMADALMILGPSIASLGLSHDLRMRMTTSAVSGSPFRALSSWLQDLYGTFRSGAPAEPTPTLADENSLDASAKLEKVDLEIQACRDRVRDVYQHLDEAGVSVAIVFKLETLSASVTRVETLVDMLRPEPEVDRLATAQSFLGALIRQSLAATGLRALIRSNLDMLARKIVERVGVTGEHYITTNKSEYWQMLKAGAGGGVVTVGTTVFKFAIGKAQMAPFIEGLFSWLNYSGSFLFMQSMHFALATKQPSMTASALGNKLRLLSHRRHLKEFVDEVARITRSQFAAAIGNVGLVVPTALLFDFALKAATGNHFLSQTYALKTIDSFNPFTSLTVPAAALTGALLWLSAVTGGWIENWFVYRRMPEAIAGNRRLRSVIGADRAERFSQSLSHNIAAIGSNLAIGFYLAFTPILGGFFGLPLDIRHITLSSGSFAFAVSSVGWSALDKSSFSFACLGIVLILILNFGVSFALALSLAVRARRIKRAWIHHLLRSVGRRLRTRTRQFLFPTDFDTPPEVAQAGKSIE